MISFKEFLINEVEGGEAPGKLEILKTDLNKAREFARKVFIENEKELSIEIPNFDKNYEVSKKAASGGSTLRKDMPVIDTKDIKMFQKRLSEGYIDVNAPFTDDELKLKDNPFPEGLTGKQAKQWLQDGLKQNDKYKDNSDDKVNVVMKSTPVGELKPIQKQIYFDKSISATAEFGAKGTTDFLKNNSIFIASADNYIIDGHHRFLSGSLIDPKMKVQVLTIDLPIKTLLPLSLAYGDAIGNKRNK